jgi:hypothetical protein
MSEKAAMDVELAEEAVPEAVSVEKAIQIDRDVQETRPSLWTGHMFRLYGILTLGYLCIVLQGYDGSLMGAINAMVRKLLHLRRVELKFIS